MKGINVSFIAAFIAGSVSLFSPCVLPLLPTYLAFLGANSDTDAAGPAGGPPANQWRLTSNMAFFFCGFTVVFVVMGAGASYIGKVFFSHQAVVRKLGAVFMVLMGMQLAGILPIPALQRERRPLLNYIFQGPVGAFMLGVALTAGWTPCVGPILATILMLAGNEGSVLQGALLLFVYALGFCLPFLLMAFVYNRMMARFSWLYPWMPWVQKISGVVIVLAGVAIYLGLN